jgi:diguanylate cyclase (GGDEF)-like protein
MSRQGLRIAVLMDFTLTEYQDKLRRGIDRFIGPRGIDAVYFGVGQMKPGNEEDLAREAFFDFITPAEFDGAVLVTASLVNESTKEALKARIEGLYPLPLVSIGPSVAGEPNVITENRAGMKAVMDHLVRVHGYRDIAFISGPLNNPEAKARLDVYHEALDVAGILHSEVNEYIGNFLSRSGFAAVEALLGDRGLKPEAIVCANDAMAMGAWRALRERGLTVPNDIALTGYDDMQVLRSVTHQFTTVRQDFPELGYEAASRLNALILGEAAAPPRPLEGRLVIRGSCGCLEAKFRRDAAADRELAAEEAEVARSMAAAIASGSEVDRRRARSLWIGTVQKAIGAKRPVDELGAVLREAERRARESGLDMEPFVASMDALLLEECCQAEILDNWVDNDLMGGIRVAVDEIQRFLNEDMELSGHADLYAALAERCRTRTFILARFEDYDRITSGARVLFSSRPIRSSTGPGAWLPESSGSLVANMIYFPEGRFGYFLMSDDAPASGIYEHLRIRLNNVFRFAETMRRLRTALSMVERLSIQDELTGLNNRRGFITLASQQLKYLRRQGAPFYVIFADLDGLKRINDAWGHKEGDLAIKSAARILRESLRESDIVSRLGGDEFTALANQTDSAGFEVIKRRINEGCERLEAELRKPWKLSMSIGYFAAPPGCEMDIEEMMSIADAELYKEKLARKGAAGLLPPA